MNLDQAKQKKLLFLLKKELEKRNQDKQYYDWDLQARSNQRLPEGDWKTWLILAGRGFGKTRTGAESIRQWVREGTCRRIALVGSSTLNHDI